MKRYADEADAFKLTTAEALEVFFKAGDAYFAPGAGPADGVALQVAMNLCAGRGMEGHTVCSGRNLCGCKLKLQSRKLTIAKPSEIHVRRRQCHPSS